MLTLTGHALEVARDRYFLPSESSWSEVARRVARALASVEKSPEAKEKWEEKFFNVINEGYFIPGGRVIRGAGAEYETSTLFNCFHIGLKPNNKEHGRDSLASILDTLKRLCVIAAAGGGVGITLSVLRPNGATIRGTGGITLGPVAWLETFDSAVATLTQSGSRRAALLMLLHDWHPDVLEYINVKRDTSRLQHMNLSVAVSDSFIQAVKNDGTWDLVFPDTTHPKYDAEWDGNIAAWREKGYPVIGYKTVKARELWSQICTSAWASAEPGLIFLDRANALRTVETEYLTGCNACAEQILPEDGVCNLGSLNLNALSDEFGVIQPKLFIDVIATAVRILDNVIDLSGYPFLNIAVTQKFTRRIGIGTMGLADLLIKRKHRYGSQESLKDISSLYRAIANAVYKESALLAQERGPAPAYEPKMLERPFLQKLDEDVREAIERFGLRNCVLLTAPPTGTTSIVAGASSGIEPIFAFEYERHDRMGVHKVVYPPYAAWKEANPGKTIPPYFVTAHDVTLKEHILVEAAVQEWVDASISKTLNAPKEVTPKEVEDAFLFAYDAGLKTISFYRDGSREGVLRKVEEKKESEPRKEEKAAGPISRPQLLQGLTGRVETPLGKAYVTLNRTKEGAPYEVFVTIGKAGSDVTALTEAIARLISLALRYRIPLYEVIAQLEGIGGRNAIRAGNHIVRSVPDAVAEFLRSVEKSSGESKHMEEPETPMTLQDKLVGAELCPVCGVAAFINQEGCHTCLNCGYSVC